MRRIETRRRDGRWQLAVLAWGHVLGLCALATAQLPEARLHGLSPPGARHGTEVEVTLRGADLDDVRELRFSHPGMTSQPKMLPAQPWEAEPQPAAGQFVVHI